MLYSFVEEKKGNFCCKHVAASSESCECHFTVIIETYTCSVYSNNCTKCICKLSVLFQDYFWRLIICTTQMLVHRLKVAIIFQDNHCSNDPPFSKGAVRTF